MQEHRSAEQIREDMQRARHQRQGGGGGAPSQEPYGAGRHGDPDRQRGDMKGLGSRKTGTVLGDYPEQRIKPQPQMPDAPGPVHDRFEDQQVEDQQEEDQPQVQEEDQVPDVGHQAPGRIAPPNDDRVLALMNEILRNRAPPRRPAQQIPMPVPVAGRGKQDIRPIIQKVTVTQKVGADKQQRKKKIKAIKTKGIATKRKQYNALKKSVKKALTAGKKGSYTEQNAKIKALPMKERAAARGKLKAELKLKFDSILKQMPAVGKKSVEELNQLISKIGKLRWT